MRLSVSDFKLWLECPHKAVWKARLGRWVPPGGALSIGTAFHRGLERWTQGLPVIGSDISTGLPALLQGVDVKDLKQAEALLRALAATPRPEFETLATEIQLSMPMSTPGIPDWELVGTLDGVIRTPDGKLWSSQGKTISSSKPIAEEFERVRDSFHELVYAMLSSRAGWDLSGVFVLCGVKLTEAARKRGQPEILLSWEEHQSDLGVRFSVLREKLGDFARDMFQEAKEHSHFRNTESCLGTFGNSPCPLFAACHQGADLLNYAERNFTHVLEDRYPASGASGSPAEAPGPDGA